MKAWHVGVAVVVDGDLGRELTALRRSLGDPGLDAAPPHLTIAPPVRLAPAGLPAALALVRAAAREVDGFGVTLGPVASFSPVTPTVHLAVDGGDAGLARLRELVVQGPWLRRMPPFVPHVTLRAETPLHLIRAATLALAGYRASFTVDRLSVLSEQRDGDGVRRWRPLADVELGGVRLVGRGGLELELAGGTVLDPEARAVLAPASAADGEAGHGPEDGLGQPGVVVTARREGEVVGAAWQAGDDDPQVLVAASARRQGIGTHLSRELDWHRRRRR
jgi:2'-5' RNA ligase